MIMRHHNRQVLQHILQKTPRCLQRHPDDTFTRTDDRHAFLWRQCGRWELTTAMYSGWIIAESGQFTKIEDRNALLWNRRRWPSHKSWQQVSSPVESLDGDHSPGLTTGVYSSALCTTNHSSKLVTGITAAESLDGAIHKNWRPDTSAAGGHSLDTRHRRVQWTAESRNDLKTDHCSGLTQIAGFGAGCVGMRQREVVEAQKMQVLALSWMKQCLSFPLDSVLKEDNGTKSDWINQVIKPAQHTTPSSPRGWRGSGISWNNSVQLYFIPSGIAPAWITPVHTPTRPTTQQSGCITSQPKAQDQTQINQRLSNQRDN